MKTSKIKDENRAQAEAFRRMHGNELELIRVYAADFRRIINDFECNYGRIPTADELLRIESECRGRDITQ